MKKQIVFIILTIISVLLFSDVYTFAGWWGDSAIPVPEGSLELKTMDMEIKGNKRKFTSYRSDLLPEEIVNFFVTQMPRHGWSQDSSLGKRLQEAMESHNSQIPDGVAPPVDIKKAMQQMFRFSKGDQDVFIVILPRSQSATFSFFNISTGEKIDVASLKKDSERPMDFAPVYPGAKLTYSGRSTYVYSADADINDIIAFYKLHMPDYAAKLIEEKPLVDKKMDSPMDCPNCKKSELPESMQKEASKFTGISSVLRGGLIFEKDSGDKISIDLAQIMSKTKQTEIAIKYNENK